MSGNDKYQQLAAGSGDLAKNLVWLASYPKSGNTWTRILLSNLLSHDGDAWDKRIELAGSISSNRPRFDNITGLPSSDLTDDEIDMLRPDIYRSIAENTEQRLFVKVHDAYHLNALNEPIFPSDISFGAIYLVRDPRDVAVSYSYHSGRESFERTVKKLNDNNQFMAGGNRSQLRQYVGSWANHYRSWTEQKEIPVLIIRYEDMLDDTEAALKKMAEFLGLEQASDSAMIADAVDRAKFDKLQAKERRDGFSEKPERAKVFFRAGRSGEGLDRLSKDEQQSIIQENGDIMQVLDYKI